MRTLTALTMTLCALLMYTAEAQSETATAPATDAGLTTDFDIPELVEIEVRYGESLYDLARWSGTDVEALESLNGIRLETPLSGGAPIVIPLTESGLKKLNRRRVRAGKRRQNRYLGRRGGLVKVKKHRMRTGETVWKIARENGRLPIWLIEAYNPKLDLNRVKIGESVHLPVLGDTVEKEVKASSPAESLDDAHDEFGEEEQGC
jgi:hypothetical protein